MESKNTSLIRLTYLDNLKVFLIMMVIIHHVGQPYGPTGGFWPYHSSLHESISWLGHFFSVNAAFFMGLFFMISGYFFPTSFDKKGAIKFLKDKLIRLGIPIAFAFLIMIPVIMYIYYLNYSGNQPISYIEYFTRIFFGIGGKPAHFHESVVFPEWNLGPLWFVEHLLIYAILYASFRVLFKNIKIRTAGMKPGFMIVILMGALIAAGCSIIRVWYPIDKWVRLLGFIQAELAHVPQYAIMLITGIIASKKQWFQLMDKRKGFVLLGLGIVMAGIKYMPSCYHSAFVKTIFLHNETIYESFMAVFLSWGSIIFFREFFNHAGELMKWLAGNSYAAYVFHLPVVLVIQYTLDKVVIGGTLGKFVVVSIASVVLTYSLCGLIRGIPGVKRVL